MVALLGRADYGGVIGTRAPTLLRSLALILGQSGSFALPGVGRWLENIATSRLRRRRVENGGIGATLQYGGVAALRRCAGGGGVIGPGRQLCFARWL